MPLMMQEICHTLFHYMISCVVAVLGSKNIISRIPAGWQSPLPGPKCIWDHVHAYYNMYVCTTIVKYTLY